VPCVGRRWGECVYGVICVEGYYISYYEEV
jgi:hypothetical protein